MYLKYSNTNFIYTEQTFLVKNTEQPLFSHLHDFLITTIYLYKKIQENKNKIETWPDQSGSLIRKSKIGMSTGPYRVRRRCGG